MKDLWLERYESEDFADLVERVWKEEVFIGDRKVSLETFYKQLHAYVRKKLKAFYSDQVSRWCLTIQSLSTAMPIFLTVWKIHNLNVANYRQIFREINVIKI